MQRIDNAKALRLYKRATEILDDHRPGRAEPILRHLAMRWHPYGMTELARRFGVTGKIAERWSDDGLSYRAWKAGDALAAHNMAMACFNHRDLAGYRRWLGRAARAGDEEAAEDLRRFETRLPHGAARDIGRGRPDLAHDGWWSAQRLARRKAAMRGEQA